MLSDIMLCSEKDPKDFQAAFDNMVEYLSVSENIEKMGHELSARNVKCTNFYDVALDYILIDSFEVLKG
jgi:predicted HTH domain antitoxin